MSSEEMRPKSYLCYLTQTIQYKEVDHCPSQGHYFIRKLLLVHLPYIYIYIQQIEQRSINTILKYLYYDYNQNTVIEFFSELHNIVNINTLFQYAFICTVKWFNLSTQPPKGISSVFILAGTFNVSLLQRFSPYKIAHADGQT